MQTRHLGDLTTGEIGYGAMVLSPGMYGPIDDQTGERAIHAALDAGCTLIDTSDGYGDSGHNESLVGRAIRGRRNEVQLATKFGFSMRPGADAHVFPVRYEFGQLAVNAEPRYVGAYLRDSLRRLQTDYVDVYYPHFPDPKVPFTDTIEAIAELIQQGLVRHLGVSNVTAAQLRAAHAVHPVSAVQTQWSMWSPIEPDLLATANDLGVGIAAWSPLGGGFLTGTVTQLDASDFRNNISRYNPSNLAANADRYAPIRHLAKTLGVTPAQLALGWLLDQIPPSCQYPAAALPPTSARTPPPQTSLSTPTLAQNSPAFSAPSPQPAT